MMVHFTIKLLWISDVQTAVKAAVWGRLVLICCGSIICTMIKIPDKGNLGKKGLILAYNLRVHHDRECMATGALEGPVIVR